MLSYAYLTAMNCCDCLDRATGKHLPIRQQLDTMLTGQGSTGGAVRYILPKILLIHRAFFEISK